MFKLPPGEILYFTPPTVRTYNIPFQTKMESRPSLVLVTGSTGFIGAHIVDSLLSRGLRVRGTTRSLHKGELMKNVRPQYASQLEFVQTDDISNIGAFDNVMDGVEAVIHTAAPVTYDVQDNEKELITPSINGVKSILQACSLSGSKVRRLVITSSFAAVIDADKNNILGPDFTYTHSHWNPITWEEAIDPKVSAVVAYRGGKKFGELEAWNFVDREKPAFDLVTLCPPMVFGPVAHPISDPSQLNESNSGLWNITQGADPLPEARVPAWINVKNLAEAHVEALLRPEAGGKRYIPAANEPFTYEIAADIIKKNFPWAREIVTRNYVSGKEPTAKYRLDGAKVSQELGVKYASFRETVVDLIKQISELSKV